MSESQKFSEGLEAFVLARLQADTLRLQRMITAHTSSEICAPLAREIRYKRITYREAKLLMFIAARPDASERDRENVRIAEMLLRGMASVYEEHPDHQRENWSIRSALKT